MFARISPSGYLVVCTLTYAMEDAMYLRTVQGSQGSADALQHLFRACQHASLWRTDDVCLQFPGALLGAVLITMCAYEQARVAIEGAHFW